MPENQQPSRTEDDAGSLEVAKLFTSEDADYQAFLAQARGTAHPERYVLGKSHADRARQFKPFAALRGYEALVEQAMADANEPHDFTTLEESC